VNPAFLILFLAGGGLKVILNKQVHSSKRIHQNTQNLFKAGHWPLQLSYKIQETKVKFEKFNRLAFMHNCAYKLWGKTYL